MGNGISSVPRTGELNLSSGVQGHLATYPFLEITMETEKRTSRFGDLGMGSGISSIRRMGALHRPSGAGD
jgi:hypothetical protein